VQITQTALKGLKHMVRFKPFPISLWHGHWLSLCKLYRKKC